MEFKHGELTNHILKAFHTAYHTQGYGFLEKVYENSIATELRKAQITVQQQFPKHEAQLLNHLKATPYEVGLLLNFGPKPEIRRKVYDNWRKPNLRTASKVGANP